MIQCLCDEKLLENTQVNWQITIDAYCLTISKHNEYCLQPFSSYS